MKYLFFIVLVLILSNTVLMADKSQLFPNIALYSQKNYTLIQLEPSRESELNQLFKSKKISKPDVYHKLENKLVLFVPKKNISTLKENGLDFEEIKNPKFKHFDPTYSTRLQKGLSNLSDLLTGYKDDVLNQKYLKELSTQYSDIVKYHEIGKTTQNRPIPAIQFLNPNPANSDLPRPSVLFNCAHHGNELTSIEHCYDIIYTILKDVKSYQKILEHLDVWVLPIVNPDGVDLFWNFSIHSGRKNGKVVTGQKISDTFRGVDINRNYPYKWNSGERKASSGDVKASFYRGEGPASELETQAMMRLFQENRFLFSFSYHAYANCILYPYSINHLKNPEPDYPKNLGKRLLRKGTSYVSGRNFELKKNIYAVDGTDQDYFYHEFGTNAYLFETSHQNPEYKKVSLILKGFRPVWQALLNEYFNDYKIVLKIVDKNNLPVEAKVSIREIKFREGEAFTSNPKNGHFFQMALYSGKYHITIESDNYKKKEIIYTTSKKVKPLTVVLE